MSVPLENRVCIDKSKKLCRRGVACKCMHLDGASVCHNLMTNIPCNESCEGFAHDEATWRAANEALENKLPRWTRNPKYAEYFAKVAEEKVMAAEQDEIYEIVVKENEEEIFNKEADDAFDLIENDRKSACKLWEENELIDHLDKVFATPPRIVRMGPLSAIAPRAPLRPKKCLPMDCVPQKLIFGSEVGQWADVA